MGTAFRGEDSHSIDAKGRLIIPAKFRELLGDSFVVTRGFDGCLFVFTMEGWESFEDKLKALPMDKPETRKIARFFISGAVDADVDKQGRILIPANLIIHAGLEKEAVIAGVGNRVEIWNKSAWEQASAFDDIDDIAAKMSEWGLSI